MSTTTLAPLLSDLRRAVDPQQVVTAGPDYDAAVALWNGP